MLGYKKIIFFVSILIAICTCGFSDQLSFNNEDIFSHSSHSYVKSFNLTDPQVNYDPLTIPFSKSIQEHIDSLNLVNIIGPSSIPTFPFPETIPETNETSFVCYYDRFEAVNPSIEQGYRKVGWEWALDKENSYNYLYLEGGRYPDSSFRATKMYSKGWFSAKKYTIATYKNIKQACLDTLNYRIGENNYRYLDAKESKSKLDYNRPLFSSDLNFVSYFRRIIAFGDSLTDTGNFFMLSGNNYPTEPYYGGRFSNGYNWIDNMSGILKIPVFNWAYASSQTGEAKYYGFVPSLKAAVDTFLKNKGISSLGYTYGGYGDFSHSLFSVYSGGNNYVDFVYTSSKVTAEEQNTKALNAIYDLQTSIIKLINSGARFILVPNLPDLGLTPVGHLYKELLTSLTLKHNEKLKNKIEELHKAYPEVTFININMYKFFEDVEKEVIKNPTSNIYNLSNATDGCYLNSGNYKKNTASSELCQNPDRYLFWDDMHPTSYTHGLVSYVITNAVFPGAENTTILSQLFPND